MINHSDLEYLKKVNGIRKNLGFSLDLNQLNQKSFLDVLCETISHIPVTDSLVNNSFSLQ